MGKLPLPTVRPQVEDSRQTERTALLHPSRHQSQSCSTVPCCVAPVSPFSQRVADYVASGIPSTVFIDPTRQSTVSLDINPAIAPPASPNHHADCRKIILLRHLGCAILQRAWDFAVIILLTAMGPPNSFYLIASYGITVNLTVALLSPSAGAMIDRANRLRAVVLVTTAQNACVLGCCACFAVLLRGYLPTYSRGWSLCIALVHVSGALNVLFQGLSNIILERDWVVVLADGDNAWLRSITANFKSIDLSCNLVAPFFVSLIQIAGGVEVLAWVFSAGNLVMIYSQHTALHRIYRDVPALALKDEGGEGESGRCARLKTDNDNHIEDEALGSNARDGAPPSLLLACMSKRTGGAFRNLFSHAHTYAKQRAFTPGLALAMLYLTVLTFHSTMLAYLLKRGLSVTFVALAQGGSSAMGVLGTFCYERAAARVGTITVGLLAIWQQVACLTVAVGALFYPKWRGDHTSNKNVEDDAKTAQAALWFFIMGIGLSRFGLYAFDVAAAQISQYMVEENARGAVGGFQRTLESVFELLSYCLVLWRPHLEQFPSLAAISYIQVIAAASFFTVFAYSINGRLSGLDPEQRTQAGVGEMDKHGSGSTSSGGSVLDLGESDALVDSPFAPSHHFKVPLHSGNRFVLFNPSLTSRQGEREREGQVIEGVKARSVNDDNQAIEPRQE